MTSLDDKAKGSPEVCLARNQQGRVFRILNAEELAPADEITPEGDFPQYGEYLRCTTDAADTEDPEIEYVEVPQGLAEALVGGFGGASESEGRWFAVESVRKSTDGSWNYEIATFDDRDGVEEWLTGESP